MLFSYSSHIIFYVFTLLIITIAGQQTCEDYSPDEGNCTKFIRCFYNLRIKFTCPPGTAWENSLKTCVWKEYVESCNAKRQAKQYNLANDTIKTYEADPNALKNVPVGRTLAEARKLGPIITPKQYQCTFCTTGACGIVINTVQCLCGAIQCSSGATTVQQRNPCAQNPCLNGGQCAQNGPGFVCNCPVQFTGNRCEAPAVTPCQPNPCLNGGQCVQNGPGFLCNCPVQFTGNRCEAPAVTPCQPNPCLNGGTCTSQGTTFLCRCPSTYTGRCCEILVTTTTPYNPCINSPCRNGGTCIPTGISFVCRCPLGYYGLCCENRNYCMPNPCSNNGFCLQTIAGYICSCFYPYTGTNCQQVITTTTTTTTTTTAIAIRAPCGSACACIFTPCPYIIVLNPCIPNPCQNMGGCAVQNNAAQCWCSNYYTGYYCQYRYTGRSLTSQACNKTCLNGGRCYIDEQNGGQARCSCSNEYYGSRCEYVNRPKSCSPKNPCMNNGKCITTAAGSQCICRKGSSGILCERLQRSTNTKYCPLDCQAGGTCVYIKSTPKCRCPKGRNGRLCESRSGKSLLNEEDELDIF